MQGSGTPEYMFLITLSQFQFVQEYLTLQNAADEAYAAVILPQLKRAAAALFDDAAIEGGNESCLTALRGLCKGHPAFAGDEGSRILAQTEELSRRYKCLSAVPAPDMKCRAADTESVLRKIGSRLFGADIAKMSYVELLEQYLPRG